MEFKNIKNEIKHRILDEVRTTVLSEQHELGSEIYSECPIADWNIKVTKVDSGDVIKIDLEDIYNEHLLEAIEYDIEVNRRTSIGRTVSIGSSIMRYLLFIYLDLK